MTLIAGFSKNGCPILMGDLLVSASDNSNKEIVFPTVGKISNADLTLGEWKPSGFCQKISLLSQKLAIAASGTKGYIRNFIREIITRDLHNNPSLDSLAEIYDRVGKQEGISIIGIYRNGNELRIFDFNARLVSTSIPGIKWFKAAGSGYGTLINVAVPALNNSALTSGQPNKLDIGISTAMQINTALLSQEVLTGTPLQRLFGAGYEILHPLRDGLAKFCDFTYLFWKTEEETRGKWRLSPFPFLASNYSYYNGLLLIRSVRLSSISGSNKCKIDSDELHAIDSIEKSFDKDELVGYAPASLNSRTICNIFLWRNYHGETGAFGTYGRFSIESTPVIWINEFKNNESIDINANFIGDTLLKIASRFRGDEQQK